MPNSGSSVGNDNESNNDMEALALVNEMSNILETKLDLESLAICYRLVEAGVNPLQLSKLSLPCQVIMLPLLQLSSSSHSSMRLMMSCVRNFASSRSYAEGFSKRVDWNSNYGNIGTCNGHQLQLQQCRMIFTTKECHFIKADYDPDKEKKIIVSGKERELKGYFKEDFNVLGREKWMIAKYWTSFFPIYLGLNVLTGCWVFLGLNVPDAASFAARWLQEANFHLFLPTWKGADDMNPRLVSGLIMMGYFQVPVLITSFWLARVNSQYRASLADKTKNGPKYERFYDEGDYENKKPPPL